MLQALIVSKDRACQLDALLRSILTYCPSLFQIRVNFVASSNEYKTGYDKLRREYAAMSVEFHEEKNLKQDFVTSMNNSCSPLFCILTDDSIFYRRVEATEKDFLDLFTFDKKLLCFSFRLGQNTIVQDYSTGRLQPPLNSGECFSFRQFIGWDWTGKNPTDNYGYPIGMDGHMFWAPEIVIPTEQLEFSSFRGWEGTLAGDRRQSFYDKPYMACFEHSVLVNIPTNGVQVPPIPFGNKYPVSLSELNERYLSDEKIDLDNMDFSNVVGCHQEIELKFTTQ